MRLRFSRTLLSGFVAILFLGGAAESAYAEEKEAVDYRLKDWKTSHFHDAEKADRIVTTLKKLGCEVEQNSHDGHIDVSYRCPEWRRMDLKTHDEAHRWESWLKTAGFQTRHEH